MGRHSRGSGEAPAPLPDPPSRHPYAPRSAEDSGDWDRRTYRVVDVGLPSGAPEPPRYGGQASRGVASRAGDPRAVPDPPGPSGLRAPDGFGPERGEPRFGATRSDLAESLPSAPTSGSRFGARREVAGEPFRAPTTGPAGPSFGGGEPRFGATRADLADPRSGGSPVDTGEARLRAPVAEPASPRFGGSRFGPDESRLAPPAPGPPPVRSEPRFGATRADLLDARLTRGDGPADPRVDLAEPRPGRRDDPDPRFGATRADLSEPRPRPRDDAGSRFGATRVDLGQPRSGSREDPDPGSGWTRVDLGEARSGSREDPDSGSGWTRVDLGGPRLGRRDDGEPRFGTTRVDLAESVGSTALAPRPAADPDEVTDTGARRARSAFRLAGEDDEDEDEHDEDADDHDEPEHEPALLLQWGIFLAQTLTGAVAGLGIWLGFYRLWSTWPFYAVPAVGVAAIAMLVLARALRRRHGRDLDLLTAVVTACVITVLTVLPAAFTLQGLTQ
ncbi:MAG TPA: hypothetical protein VH573_16080 [Mycobacteriales bacterium]